MGYLALLLQIAACTISVSSTTTIEEVEEPRKLILHEAILKDQSKTTWMNCNFHENNTKCAWILGPLDKTLTSDDPPDPLARHLVEISNTSDNCVLRINDINYGDEGFYDCIVDNDPPMYRWHLVIQGDPGRPVIYYSNGTVVWDDMIAVDETPVTISLKCISTGARPKHNQIYWFIDGNVVDDDNRTTMTGPIAGLWEAASEISVTFSEVNESESALKSVSCVTDHATGDAKTTKVFGLRNLNDTLYLVHHERMNRERGRLECLTDLFPRPRRFEILRLVDDGNEENSTHLGQGMYVKYSGRYVCRARVVMDSNAPGGNRMASWLESNILEAEGDREFVSSAPSLTTTVGSVWRRMFLVCIVAANMLTVNWAKNAI